jgi:hypothetical protein
LKADAPGPAHRRHREFQLEKSTRIAIGHAATADPFQCGREAAEAARAQLLDITPDLVLAIGPSDASFKDFIEGVRLVAGESSLVGIPVPWARSTEAPGNGMVVFFAGAAQRLSVVCAAERDNALRGATSLITELRRRRGNARLDFNHHGLLAFDSALSVERGLFAHLLASEAGLESWLAGFGLWSQGAVPIVCGSRAVAAGLAAVECLTEDVWGLGWVDTSSFPDDHVVRREAAKSAVREALSQLGHRKPAAVFLFFATANRPADPNSAVEAFVSARSSVPSVPIIGIPVRSPYLRVRSGIVTVAPEAVVALVVPA